MTRVPAIFLPVLFATLLPVAVLAQTEQGWDVEGLNQVIPGAPAGGVTYDFASGAATGTNIFVKYGNSTLMADSASVNQKTGEVVADGHVRIESGGYDLGWRTYPLQFPVAPDAERGIPHGQATGVRGGP